MSDLLHRLKHTDTDYTINEVVSYIETLQEKLATAEKWDVIESQRNEKLQARVAELEKRLILKAICPECGEQILCDYQGGMAKNKRCSVCKWEAARAGE